MRKKSEAQVFLGQVEKLDAIITNKLIERQQWREIALGITSGGESIYVDRNGKRELHNMEKVQSSGSPSKLADAVVKCVDMEAEIDRLVDKLIDRKQEVIQTIEKLDSPTEYKLLHLRYIQFVPLVEIADRWGWEYTNVTTTHGRALKNVQNILDRKMVCDFV